MERHLRGRSRIRRLLIPFALIAAFVSRLVGQAIPVAPIVTVTGGEIRGSLLDRGEAVFKGVPFAQPPVGNLRWREPLPPARWQGVRDTLAFGPPCAQSRRLQPDLADISDEDCLYLNVWAPEWPSKSRKPVMVWIPGGGNFGDTSNLPKHDGESLARHGVVVVTINYRLSLFGFLAHPELTRESPHRASGNYGLLDQIAALRWVRDNIARFGGDPDNVTIFGESAGAFDVSFLMTSPLAENLFHRAIAQSGAVTTVGNALPLEQAERQGESVMGPLAAQGVDVLAVLRKLSPARILEAEPQFLTPMPPPSLLAIVDGYVLPKSPTEVFARGQQHRMPLIIGSTAQDRIPGSTPPSDLPGAIRSFYGARAPRAVALYGIADNQAPPPHPRYGSVAEQWATDTTFRCSSVLQAVWHAAASNPTYHYEFDRVPRGREQMGARHASEVPYIFGVLTPEVLRLAEFDGIDREVSQTMQRYWTNFAKTGDPNGRGLGRWPRFQRTSRSYMTFTEDGPMVRDGLRRPFCDLYMEHLGHRSQ